MPLLNGLPETGNNGKVTVNTGTVIDITYKDPSHGSTFSPQTQGGFLSNFSSPNSGTYNVTRLPNELENFASFNVISTLSALSPEEVNDPAGTYRKVGAKNVVIRSGGAPDKIPTAYERDAKTEYYIDNINMESVVSTSSKTGASTATNVTFTVQEPYSMGTFLQTLQLASVKAGYFNYLEAPYLLEIDFVGWDQNGFNYKAKKSRRFIPILLVDVTFTVGDGGTIYEVEGVPWNEIAFSDETQSLKTDTSFTGQSVAELLNNGVNSLTTVINRRLEEFEEKDEIKSRDYFIINFPKDRKSTNRAIRSQLDGVLKQDRPIAEIRQSEGRSNEIPEGFEDSVETRIGQGANANNIAKSLESLSLGEVNEIGESLILADKFAQGTHPFGIARFAHQETENGASTNIFKRNGTEGIELSLSQNSRMFKFASGYKIQRIIEEVVLTSDYGRKISEAIEDENGYVNWFKVESQVFSVPTAAAAQVAQTGTSPKVFVYSVVPYKVAKEKILLPSQGNPAQETRKNRVLKEYNYIYTGENKDIINFDIEFKTAFYSSILADSGQTESSSRADGQNSAVAENEPGNARASGNEGATGERADYQKQVRESINTYINSKGGAGFQEVQSGIAKIYHESLVNSDVDLITSNLEIWGDPYFIPDSGMGNYNADPGENIYITGDGSIDYQRSEVDVIINFRTPIDYGKTLMEFPSDTVAVKAFSGLYQVITVTSKIEGGKFTQELELVRRNNQELKSALTTGMFEKTTGQSKLLDSGTIPPLLRAPAVGNTQPQSPQLVNTQQYVDRLFADPLSVLSDEQRARYNAGEITDDISALLSDAGQFIDTAIGEFQDSLGAALSGPGIDLDGFIQEGLDNFSGVLLDADQNISLLNDAENLISNTASNVLENTQGLIDTGTSAISSALNTIDDKLPPGLL